jgi:hypothetical protein
LPEWYIHPAPLTENPLKKYSQTALMERGKLINLCQFTRFAKFHEFLLFCFGFLVFGLLFCCFLFVFVCLCLFVFFFLFLFIVIVFIFSCFWFFLVCFVLFFGFLLVFGRNKERLRECKEIRFFSRGWQVYEFLL